MHKPDPVIFIAAYLFGAIALLFVQAVMPISLIVADSISPAVISWHYESVFSFGFNLFTLGFTLMALGFYGDWILPRAKHLLFGERVPLWFFVIMGFFLIESIIILAMTPTVIGSIEITTTYHSADWMSAAWQFNGNFVFLFFAYLVLAFVTDFCLPWLFPERVARWSQG